MATILKLFDRANNNEKNHSFSESDLTDDSNIFRRRKYLPGFQPKSQVNDEPGLPFYSTESENSWQFKNRCFRLKPNILRRSTSLHLKGLMRNKSEHQEQFRIYTLADYKLSRGSHIKNAENLFISGINMEPEYRSSYISYPMVNRTSKILPREAFRLFSEISDKSSQPEDGKKIISKNLGADNSTSEQGLHKICFETKYNTESSEYKQQFVRFPIEKARSIPQISHLKIKGEFGGVPEYKDSFKIYETYSKSAPIKKGDNLRMSGAQEVDAILKMPEYHTQFKNLTEVVSNEKLLKIDNHIHACGKIAKDLAEYDESFRDPQIKHMPERGKCREPYLRLKGKIEFDPEYRNTFLDFPRSRPVIRKPASTLLLSNTLTTSKAKTIKKPKESQRLKLEACSTNVHTKNENLPSDIIITPEYRRANYQYQMRERTPVINPNDKKVGDYEVGLESKTKFLSIMPERKSSFVSTNMAAKQKRHISSNRQKSTESQLGTSSGRMIACATKNTPKFGRRSSVVPNSSNFGSSMSYRSTSDNSFVVLNQPHKQSPWTKTS